MYLTLMRNMIMWMRVAVGPLQYNWNAAASATKMETVTVLGVSIAI